MATSNHFSGHRLPQYLLVGTGGSLVILAFLFYATARPDQDVAPAQIFSAITSSSLVLFLVYVALGLVGIWVRAIRYRVLIIASGEKPENIPSTRTMLLVTAVRGMVVDLLPARLGELIYVALLKRISGTTISSGLSSLIFAMALDIAVLAPVTILLSILIGFPNATPVKVALVALVVVALFYIGFRYILPALTALAHRRGWTDGGVTGKVFELANHLNDATEATIKAGILLRVLVLTIIVRSLKYIGLLVLFHSVSSASFPELALLADIEVLAAMIASEMSAALPIPTLMSFGAWEIGGMTFLALFGAMPGDSLMTLLAVHILTQSVDYGVGLAALLLVFMQQRDHPASFKGARLPRLPMAFAIGCCLLAVIAWYQFDQAKNQIELVPAGPGIAFEQRPAWLQQARGFIVWSSNSMGNHNIMLMQLDDLSVRPLTVHPHTETHPRISPDGSRVAFSRSHRIWQSWRNQKPWDIWIVDIHSGKETRIAEFGTAPSWSADGNELYFNRYGSEIWSYNFSSKQETKLYQSGIAGLPDAELFWPSVDKKGTLAVSYKDKGRPTNIIADARGNITVVARGCMLTWSPDNEFAMFVSNTEGGKQKNQLNRFHRSTGKISRWLDLPGNLSHEYFPRLSQSQQYLVFAASDGAHEPDIEDYEIFIWKTDTPENEAQRLTFNRGNDSWPDIFVPPGDG